MGFTRSKFQRLMGTTASGGTPGTEPMYDFHDAASTVDEYHVNGISHESGVNRSTWAQQQCVTGCGWGREQQASHP